MVEPSVSVEAVVHAGHGWDIVIKIGTPMLELNVLVPAQDVDLLKRVRQTAWLSGALCIGTSAGAPAWWCVSGEEDDAALSILVGQDDQTWDIALQLPIETIDVVLTEVESCVRQTRG